MVKLKEFITNLAKKAGYNTDSDAAKPFFDALPDTDVPEEVQKGIDTSLISLTEAKNNFPDLKNHYTKQALDGIDKSLLELIEDFQLDDETKAEILAEKSTYKRAPLLSRKLVELERKKLSANTGKDKQEIQKQIDELHSQLKAEKEGRMADKTKYDNEILQNRLNTKKNLVYSSLKTIHDELDPDTRYEILDAQLRKALQDNGAKLIFDEQGELVLLRNDGTNFFGENHQRIKPLQFIESTLAKNKQLKVTDPKASNGAQQPHSSQTSTQNGNGKSESNQSAVIDLNKRAMADYEAASKNGSFGV